MKALFLSLVLFFTTSVFAMTPLTTENFHQEMEGTTGVTVFTADWCPTCKEFMPIMEELEVEFEGQLKFMTVDIEDQPDLKGVFVNTVPTTYLVCKGSVVAAIAGYGSLKSVREALQTFLNKCHPKI